MEVATFLTDCEPARRKPSNDFTQAIQAEINKQNARRVVLKLNAVKDAVCQFYKVSAREIISERRNMEIIWPRQVAYYLCRELTPASYPRIGQFFGGRDHTTVIHGVRKVEKKIGEKPYLADEIARISFALSKKVQLK